MTLKNTSILLKNVQAVTLNEANEVINKCSIEIKDDKITNIFLNDVVNEQKYDVVLDCTGKTVMPGLINGHNHAAMVMFRNYADDMKLMDWLFNKIFPLEDKLTFEFCSWASKLAIIEMIKSGTTTFSDMYFFMDALIEAVGETGIRANLSRGLQGDTGIEVIDDRLKENISLYENYNNSFDGRIKIMLGPHAVYTCTPKYLEKVAIISKEKNIPVQIHLAETEDEVKNCIEKYGTSPVKLLDKLGILNEKTVAAHCVKLYSEDIDILEKCKVNVVHNPSSNLKLASGIAPISDFIKRGINVCLGTDGASSNNKLDMFEEMRLAALLQKVYTDDPTSLNADQVLNMAVKNGAKAFGLSDVGSINIGMKADLIILNTEKPHYYPKYNIKSAIAYSSNSQDVESVIINGKLVMNKGTITTIDEEKVLYEVERCSKELIG